MNENMLTHNLELICIRRGEGALAAINTRERTNSNLRESKLHFVHVNLNNYMYSHLALLRKSCAKTVPSLVAWMDLCSLDVPLSIRSPFRSIRGGRSHWGAGGREKV